MINSEGTKSLKIITRNERRFKVNKNYTEKVNSVQIGQCGDQKWWDWEGVKMQIQNADVPIIQLYQVWKVKEICFATELRIFRNTVLYGGPGVV